MNLRSLRWRLLLAGAVAVLAALALSAAALAALFERHVERVAVAELEARALVLAAIVEQEPGSAAILSGAPVDPLYDQPFSGRYWQIVLGQEMRRSRSLWDFVLAMEETASPPGETRVRAVPGPRGEPLLAVETALLVGQGANQQRLRILVATDRTQLDLARRGFLGDLLPFVGLFALLLIGASWVQISVGLKPLAEVGRRVAALAGGTRPRMGEDLPTEVIPLARQIDTLLDARDDELARARHRAGDLAHGFKTPLQALLGDAGLLRERGETEVAGSVETVALAMRRLVDRELARARIQSDRTAASADPGLVLEKIVGVLRRTPRGGVIDWQTRIAPGVRARIDPDDLTEALGPLLENAMRHARASVTATVAIAGGEAVITVRDDGDGVPEADLARLVQRGVRLDEAGDGTGIGLAIVSDIAEAAAGTLDVRNAAPGLEVELRLALAAPRI